MTAAQHVSVPVNHMTMTVVNHNAHSRENKWTNHIALMTAAQHVSVSVNHMTMTVVNHAANHLTLSLKMRHLMIGVAQSVNAHALPLT